MAGPTRWYTVPMSVVIAGLVAGGCQTTGLSNTFTPQSDGNTFKVSHQYYAPFYNQAAHLRALVQEKKLVDAATLVREQWDYFAANLDKSGAALAEVAGHLNSRKDDSLDPALAQVKSVEVGSDPRAWATARETLSGARRVIQDYADHPLLAFDARKGFLSRNFIELRDAAAALEARFAQAAPQAFATFDHFAGESFFAAYPVDLDWKDFLESQYDSVEPQLAGARSDQIERFASTYGEAQLGEVRWSRLGTHLHAAYLRETAGGNADLRANLEALRRATAAGFKSEALPGPAIAFVEVTSRTLLKEGQVMFAAQIEADLPAKLVKAELDDAFKTGADIDYAIVFDVALAKAARKVTATRKMPAKTIVGYRTEANPDYHVAQQELAHARLELGNATIDRAATASRTCYGLGCLINSVATIAAASRVDTAKEKVDALMESLRTTPQTIEKPVYREYRYDLATVNASKVMTVNYYVIDRRTSTYFKSTFDVEERKRFEVAYRIQPNDPDKDRHAADASVEKDVVEWEEAPSTVKLSQLVDHYLAHAGSVKPLVSPERLRAELLRDKNVALAKASEGTFEGSTQSDPRFDSVVVVFNPDGTFGSGFYVAPDVVMTNYHVVEEREFVELRLYGGRESFGKVIARDVRLDLALIRVQSRGKPVQFFDANKLDLGSTVEVIGHPRGYEFSITRGVVSAVREMPNANINDSRKVLFVQIDAPASPGNSGGPVFMKDKVIGVVSWGRSDQRSENLNFSVHYSEAVRFIKDYLDASS